jgi:hypothetical protein
MAVESGISNDVIDRLKSDTMKFEECSLSQKKIGVGLLMDESGLVFNKWLEKLIGFVNLGETNQDFETLESSLCSNDGTTSAKAFIFLSGSSVPNMQFVYSMGCH